MLLDKENMTRQYINDYLKEQQIEPGNILEVTTMDLLIEFAKISLGIACVIRQFVQPELNSGILTEIPLSAPLHKREVGFALSEFWPAQPCHAGISGFLLFPVSKHCNQAFLFLQKKVYWKEKRKFITGKVVEHMKPKTKRILLCLLTLALVLTLPVSAQAAGKTKKTKAQVKMNRLKKQVTSYIKKAALFQPTGNPPPPHGLSM